MDKILMRFDKAIVEPRKGSPYKENKPFKIITIRTDRKSITLFFDVKERKK